MNLAAPASEREAEERSEAWRNRDPFPTITPALLNSADIIDYVTVTGMIFPFRPEKEGEKKLKPASYEVDFLGAVKYWDEVGNEVTKTIGVGDAFILKRNSIAFVQVEPIFRLPNYIAVRFNLKIQHVYRGILLGTGPLVDPGFRGPLYIPLHNLTNNDYTFRGGEGLIWMEFTKLSWPPPGETSHEAEPQADGSSMTSGIERTGRFVDFPERKLLRRTLDDYLYYANPHGSIRSSIPVEVQAARKAAKRARRLTNIGIVAIFATVVGVGGLIFQAMLFVRSVRMDVAERLKIVEQEVTELKRRVTEAEEAAASPPRTGLGRRDRNLAPEGAQGPESVRTAPSSGVTR